jgi:hypothetical protein
MTKLKFLCAAAVLAAMAIAPTMAQARNHHRHYAHWYGYPYGLAYEISFLHNYGPGPAPGTFAYYDGPSTNLCYQGSAAYRGQDHRRHPCF